MKNALSIFLTIIVLSTLPGCKNMLPSGVGISDLPSELSYEIITEVYTEQPLSSEDIMNVQYPQIRGLADSDKETTINKMIREYIIEAIDIGHMDPTDPFYSEAVYDHEVFFRVTTQTTERLSVVFVGESRFYSSGRPYYRSRSNAFAITIDLVNAQRMQLSDVMAISLPGEEHPGLDLSYRILRATECYEYGESTQKQMQYWANTHQGVPLTAFEEIYDSFFVEDDVVYYIRRSDFDSGGYIIVKPIDDPGPYEPIRG